MKISEDEKQELFNLLMGLFQENDQNKITPSLTKGIIDTVFQKIEEFSKIETLET